jgi:two-component system phosphate regulon sensor histidine kinase PhoR
VSVFPRPSRRVLPLYAGAVFLVTAAFAWLGWRLLQYEEDVAVQQMQQRLDAAADLAAAAILRQTSDAAAQLTALAALPDEEVMPAARRIAPAPDAGARLVVIADDKVGVFPAGGLAYYPSDTSADSFDAVFAGAEANEFGRNDSVGAVRVLGPLVDDRNPTVRAGALLRLGRNLQKLGRPADALEAYDRLMTLRDTPVGGLPAELVARYARCTIFEKLQQAANLERDAAALLQDLQQGRWRIDRSTYLFYLGAVERWLPVPGNRAADPSRTLELAAAVDMLWMEWRRLQRGEGDASGIRAAGAGDRRLMLMWRSAPGRLVAFVAEPGFIERQWLASTRTREASPPLRLALVPGDGTPAPGPRLSRVAAVRATGHTGLPWMLHVASADPAADDAQIAVRRRVILGALGLVGCLLAVSAYSIGRAITREVQTLRIQSDFIAAVSHEFRSPLTSMRQISELLASGRVASEDRRGTYYNLLTRESGRLHRLVESLLDFGRTEAGAGEYRRDPLDLGRLVRETVAEFGRDAAERGYTIELTGADAALPVRGDAEALGRALWNLLDNAVKYSPDCRTVWVAVARDAGSVTLKVEDRGAGIPASEQEAIFGKFVRGAAARTTGAKGTGLGLAMVRHIVRGHGGEIAVVSEKGSGSTFTVTIPVAEGEV